MIHNTIRIPILLLALVAMLLPVQEVAADHGSGADIRYIHIGGDNYRVYYRFFRDCSGVGAPPIAGLCYSNPCNNDFGIIYMPILPTGPNGRTSGTSISTSCTGHPTKCQSATSTLPGYQEYWYTGLITLPSKCHEWRLSVAINARNDNENLVPNANLTSVAIINNLNVSDNSSAFFSVDPVTYVCNGHTFIYNNGTFDPDGDSLVFDLIQPLNGGACPSMNTNVPFTNGTPPYNTTNNPFQTNNTFSINSRTGAINCIPGMLGAHTITVRAKEYRGQVMVGSTIRDLQVQVLPCNPPPVTLNLSPASFNNSTMLNNEMVGCSGTQFSFCYDIVSNTPGTILTAIDNHAVFGSGATNTYTGQNSGHITGCFTYTSAPGEKGLKILAITVKDTTCKPPGIINSYTFTIPVRINSSSPAPSAISPVYVCLGQPAPPLQATGSNLMWYTSATGGSGSGTPIVPATTNLGPTTYYVTQNTNGCESPRKPIVADVQPNVSTNVSSDKDSVCLFKNVTLTDVATNSPPMQYNWDLGAGGYAPGGDSTQQVTIYWNTEGLKNVVLVASNKGCTKRDTTLVYALRTPIADWEIPPVVCRGQVAELYPAKEPDAVYDWMIDGQDIIDAGYKPVYKLTWKTLGVKKITLTLSNTFLCSTTKTDSVTVRESPEINIVNNNGYLCVGKEFTLETTYEERVKYSWTPAQYFSQNGSEIAKGVVEQSGNVYLSATNTWGCVSSDSVFLYGGPCCEVFMPGAFTPNNDGYNDGYKPVDIEAHTLIQFMIVNRQGLTVFETTDPGQRWDGTYKGEPQGIGTFSYYMKYICADGNTIEKKGNFILIR